MKKNLLKLIIVLSFGFIFLNGQTANAQSYKEGDNLIHVGIGFPSLYSESVSGLTGATTSGIPPVYGSFEHGINEHWSVGGYLAYTSQSVRFPATFVDPNTYAITTGTQGWDLSIFVIGVTGDYHFATGDAFDPYVGAMVGYGIVSNNGYSSDPNNPYTGFGSVAARAFFIHIGANYYFTDSFGIHAELGYGLSLVNIGASLKF
jgi:hypothetical protein